MADTFMSCLALLWVMANAEVLLKIDQCSVTRGNTTAGRVLLITEKHCIKYTEKTVTSQLLGAISPKIHLHVGALIPIALASTDTVLYKRLNACLPQKGKHPPQIPSDLNILVSSSKGHNYVTALQTEFG